MSKRDTSLLLNDILLSIERIFMYTDNLSLENFSDQFMVQDAVLRNFTIIGEAITRLPESFREQQSQIEWKVIKDFRNRVVHDYVGIDIEVVWDIITKRLFKLREDIKAILDSNSFINE
jgi:uncharacterized protein with HEPN domain